MENILLDKSLGISSKNSVRNYIDFLERAFLVRRLYPYSNNMLKRIVKSPKIYIRDTGMLHHLFRIYDINELPGNIVAGNSWEGFIIQQIISELVDYYEFYFYRTHQGAEIGLVLVKGLKPVIGIEIKLTSVPSLSKGNLIAIEDLHIAENYLITPESDDYLLHKHLRVCSITKFINHYIPLLKHKKNSP